MLGLVVGPGEVLGVGLVVLGMSVPMPPAGEPSELLAPEVPLLSEGMVFVPVVPVLPVASDPLLLVPLVSEGMPEVPLLSDGMPDVLLPLGLPELLSVPESEPPPVMPAHAPSSIAQAMGNIHFVIDHSRKVQRAVRVAARTGHCVENAESRSGRGMKSSGQRRPG